MEREEVKPEGLKSREYPHNAKVHNGIHKNSGRTLLILVWVFWLLHIRRQKEPYTLQPEHLFFATWPSGRAA